METFTILVSFKIHQGDKRLGKKLNDYTTSSLNWVNFLYNTLQILSFRVKVDIKVEDNEDYVYDDPIVLENLRYLATNLSAPKRDVRFITSVKRPCDFDEYLHSYLGLPKDRKENAEVFPPFYTKCNKNYVIYVKNKGVYCTYGFCCGVSRPILEVSKTFDVSWFLHHASRDLVLCETKVISRGGASNSRFIPYKPKDHVSDAVAISQCTNKLLNKTERAAFAC